MRGEDIFEDLDSTQTDELWRPEFASYMLEGTPGQPYGSTLKDLLKVEKVRVKTSEKYGYTHLPRMVIFRANVKI